MPQPAMDSLFRLYRRMVLIRRCEEQLARAHQRGLVHGACHTYVGQEAIAVGVCAHLRQDDVVFSTHRGHGHALAKGVPPCELIAELFGRATGCSRGRGGSMHLFAPEVGMMGTSGIVGPCILAGGRGGLQLQAAQDRPRGGGVLRRWGGQQRRVSRRAEPGQHLEAAGAVRLREQPVRHRSAVRLRGRQSERRQPRRGLRHARRRSRTATTCWRSTQPPAKRSQRARAGGGPTLLECKTYRTRPHAEGMGDFTYRTREEVEEWKTRCPIQRLARRCSRSECRERTRRASTRRFSAKSTTR